VTVRREVKNRRMRIVAEHVTREYERTGLNAAEQGQARVGPINPIHMKIMRRWIESRQESC
jgi:hypothetical protein